MQLSKRLMAVAALAGESHYLADIGTDHGYIPIYLCEHNKIKQAIAMDVNKGPLERADKNIRAHCLEHRISTRLSDGLHALKAGEADTIVIAGMGGALTIRILEEGEQIVQGLQKMVLQPQSEIHLVRRYLYEKGCQITREDMIFEDGKYYPMMLVEKAEMMKTLSEVQYYYGPDLLQKNHPVLMQFLEKEELSLEKIETALKQQNGDRISSRLQEVEKQKKLVSQAKEMFA